MSSLSVVRIFHALIFDLHETHSVTMNSIIIPFIILVSDYRLSFSFQSLLKERKKERTRDTRDSNFNCHQLLDSLAMNEKEEPPPEVNSLSEDIIVVRRDKKSGQKRDIKRREDGNKRQTDIRT